MERKLLFLNSVRHESESFHAFHSITRAFVFSYYDLLRYLGIEIPNQYKEGGEIEHEYEDDDE